jgi:DNA-binding GntR family transcriptional regulator
LVAGTTGTHRSAVLASSAPEAGNTTDATERAYQEIRRRIVTDVYTPGTRLPEADLASSLDVSRTPVRSALVRLGVEGLVEMIPRRGAFVAKWSLADVEEIFGLRIALEPLAAALAARKIRPTEVEQLRDLAARMEAALQDGQSDRSYVDASTELNARFHHAVIAAARNHQLRSMLGTVIELPLMHRTIAEFEPQRLGYAWVEHRTIVEALQNRDERLAESVMLVHLLAARDVIRRMLVRRDST